MDDLAKYVFIKPKASLKKRIELDYEKPKEQSRERVSTEEPRERVSDEQPRERVSRQLG